MKELDCLFLHPTTHIKSPEGVDHLTNVVMPVGTIALADLLDREGYGVRIFHTGVEQRRDRAFSVESLFKKYDASVVGIDLHWYVHAYDAIRIANIVKKLSNAFVVLGGFTATFFAEEILSRFNSVDGVICGDAEIPLLELLAHRSSGGLDRVPNLLYRDGESLKRSKGKYIADASDLDKLSYSNLSLLENSDEYSKVSISQCGDVGPFALGSELKTQGWFSMGRGCSMDCPYCGGGRNAYQILTGRDAPIFHSKERVVETLTRFEEMKISSTYIHFDPYPTDRRYYRELFAMIRDERVDIGSQFGLWALSDRDFLMDFRRTFNPLYSTISLFPRSGSEHIRKLNTSFYYDNEELLRWLSDAKHETIPTELYFTSGLSWETERDFEETIQLSKKIIEEYPMVVTLGCYPIELEPCCPRFLSPKDWGVTLKFRKFLDYYDTFKGYANGLPVSSRLVYETDHLSESQIIELSQRFNKIISSTYYDKWQKLMLGEKIFELRQEEKSSVS